MLCEVLDFLRTLTPHLRPTGLVLLASACESRFLPMLTRLVTGKSDAVALAGRGRPGTVEVGDGDDDNDNLVEWNVSEVLRVDEYQDIAAGTRRQDEGHRLRLRSSIVLIVEAVCRASEAAETRAATEGAGSDAEAGWWLLDGLVANGKMLDALARVLGSPDSGAARLVACVPWTPPNHS